MKEKGPLDRTVTLICDIAVSRHVVFNHYLQGVPQENLLSLGSELSHFMQNWGTNGGCINQTHVSVLCYASVILCTVFPDRLTCCSDLLLRS